MDPSYKLRDFFIKTAQVFQKLKTQESAKNKQKLALIQELEEDIFYMRESVKKMLNDKKITDLQYEKISKKIKQIEQEIKIIKKRLTNL